MEKNNGTDRCDWCEVGAVVTIEDGSACTAHVRELERLAEARIWQSGNPFAGEAAELHVQRDGGTK